MPSSSPELAGALAALGAVAGSTAVELGCGTGADLARMARLGLKVIGVDLSETAVGLARSRVFDGSTGSSSVLVGDALHLALRASSASLVTDRGCLHYLPDEVRAVYAAEVHRVLRPGGLLLVRGMADGGVAKHPVTPETIGVHFRGPRFEIRSAIEFDMVGTRGHKPATFAIIERRA